MKNEKLRSFLDLLMTPALMMVLGLVLLVNPDSASVLIAKVLGWALILVGIGFGIAAIAADRGRIGKGIAAVAFAVLGGWLAANPLVLAAWIGRIVGALLVIDGLQDMMQAKKRGTRALLPLIVAAVGVILVALPMTTSRVVFSLAGLVVLVVGFAMLVDRLKGRRRLNRGDSDIIDAL